MSQRRVLMVSYWFPPGTLSAPLRMGAFARYLPEHGWEPLVIAPRNPEAQDAQSKHAQIYRVPAPSPGGLRQALNRGGAQAAGQPEVTPSLDSQGAVRRFGIAVRDTLLLPDNAGPWIPFAFAKGLRVARRERPSAILSSFPPISDHIIAMALSRILGLPWIADFRDPCSNSDVRGLSYYHPVRFFMADRAEAATFRRAAAVTVVTRANEAAVRGLYPAHADKVELIPNGYDPFDLQGEVPPVRRSPVTFVHCGNLGQERSSLPLLKAVADLLTRRPELRSDIRLRFVGSIDEQGHRFAQERGLQDMLELPGRVSHEEATAEMQAAGVLVMVKFDRKESGEARSFTDLCVPAKLYEYLVANRPVLGITLPSEAADLLKEAGHPVVSPADGPGLARAVEELYEMVRIGREDLRLSRQVAASYSRQALTGNLAALLARVVGLR